MGDVAIINVCGRLEGDERKFFEHLLETYLAPVSSAGPNRQAVALLRAVQDAFADMPDTPSKRVVTIDLVANLAACGWISLSRDQQDGGLENQDRIEHVLSRLVCGFINSLVLSVRASLHWKKGGKTMIGCLELPDWFLEFSSRHEGV